MIDKFGDLVSGSYRSSELHKVYAEAMCYHLTSAGLVHAYLLHLVSVRRSYFAAKLA